jgi:hypothetical protein
MTSGNHTVCLAWLPHMVKLFPATIYCSYLLLRDIRKNYIRCLGSQNAVNGNTSDGWLSTHSKNGLATVKNESQFKLNSFTVISDVRVIMYVRQEERGMQSWSTGQLCLGTIHCTLTDHFLGHNILVSLGRPSFCAICYEWTLIRCYLAGRNMAPALYFYGSMHLQALKSKKVRLPYIE